MWNLANEELFLCFKMNLKQPVLTDVFHAYPTGSHYWDYIGTLSLIKSLHLIEDGAAADSNELQRLYHMTGYQDNSLSNSH